MVFGRKKFDLWPPHATSTVLGGARPITPYLDEAISPPVGCATSSSTNHELRMATAKHTSPFSSSPAQGRIGEEVDTGPIGDPSTVSGALSLILESDYCLFLPAGWWHATSNLVNDDPDSDCPPPANGQIGCSVNFFCASCFAGLGVIAPDIFASDWPIGFEPGTACDERGRPFNGAAKLV
uniref:JmjC domain-containing protein n=1 Tax=Octactis speculum TaxID=3111310 RepID=A0A7S2FCK9_9STRA